MARTPRTSWPRSTCRRRRVGLVAAAPPFNGPSGRSLDEDFLGPLGIGRTDAWLCDLVPHTCLNAGQRAAIRRAYEPRRGSCGLPEVDLPVVPETFADDARRGEVLAELEEAKAEIVVLLGDQPIRHFLAHHDSRWRRLRDFEGYGRLHSAVIGGKGYKVLPLAHPRQVGGLGKHSSEWRKSHGSWKTGAIRLCS
jgi:uracil-DNA glycosylase